MERAKELIGKYEKISLKINTGTQHNTLRCTKREHIFSITRRSGEPAHYHLCPKRKKFGDNSSGSSDAPIIISLPLTARPLNTSSSVNHRMRGEDKNAES
jgi:hypothetical protein